MIQIQAPDTALVLPDTAFDLFVVGDLIIDHSVFRGPTNPQFELPEITSRQDTAGGAATTARMLAVLNNEGTTYLWGVLGSSLWGPFRRILEHSQALDTARETKLGQIEFRGAKEETDAPMSTITRVIEYQEESYRRRSGFCDLGRLHVSEAKRRLVLYHMRSIHPEKSDIRAVIVNDFGLNTLTNRTLGSINAFCNKEDIPLFLDPCLRSGERQTQSAIHPAAKGAMGILPNLEEWCHLVGVQGNDVAKWRSKVHNRDRAYLQRMARLSVEKLPNFRLYVIKCDEEGYVLIVPAGDNPRHYRVFAAQPAPNPVHDHQRRQPRSPEQLGCGDVFTAVFASTFVALRQDRIAFSEESAALHAAHFASVACACYRDEHWHRMPSRERISQHLRNPEVQSRFPKKACEDVSLAFSFVPTETEIKVSELPRPFKGLIRSDPKWHEEAKRLKDHLRWLVGTEKVGDTGVHVLIGAEPSGGKTAIIRDVESLAGELGCECLTFANYHDDLGRLDQEPEEWLKRKRDKANTEKKPCVFVIIDEGLKEKAGGKPIPDLKNNEKWVSHLNSAAATKVFFILVDALAIGETYVSHNTHQECLKRFKHFMFPRLAEFPYDIGLKFLGDVWRASRNRPGSHHAPFTVDKGALEAFLAVMSQQSAKIIDDRIRLIVEKSIQTGAIRTADMVAALVELKAPYNGQFQTESGTIQVSD